MFFEYGTYSTTSVPMLFLWSTFEKPIGMMHVNCTRHSYTSSWAQICTNEKRVIFWKGLTWEVSLLSLKELIRSDGSLEVRVKFTTEIFYRIEEAGSCVVIKPRRKRKNEKNEVNHWSWKGSVVSFLELHVATRRRSCQQQSVLAQRQNVSHRRTMTMSATMTDEPFSLSNHIFHSLFYKLFYFCFSRSFSFF